jgi:peptidoglycan/LPS O-acetylase OafA/YrhL
MMQRIDYLDGLRGVAILLVIVYHAFSRWAELMPYGDQFSEIPIFKYGYLGVQLFFLISGFVILMTLEKSSTIVNFMYRRWLRLFPAMLFCSLIVYFSAEFFIERPNGQPVFKDLLAGISFIDPHLWLKLTGLKLHSVEGAFWSLYVEVKFYAVAAVLYFLIGSKRLVLALFTCFIFWLFISYISNITSGILVKVLYSISDNLSFKFFGWFSAGAAFYIYATTKESKWFAIGVIFSFFSAVVGVKPEVGAILAAIFVSLLFSLAIVNETLQKFLSNRILMYFGFVSYPLYLLHENMMVSITIKLGAMTNVLPSYLFPVIAILLISFLSYLISKRIEPMIKRGILRGIKIAVLNRPNFFKV